mmetsp:Transcript_34834/g.86646  ORF Transcript_34834/g.86646 Transcript_34834/m.86646 type:complete len:105 (+) Transcript_34834:721-1035(+)
MSTHVASAHARVARRATGSTTICTVRRGATSGLVDSHIALDVIRAPFLKRVNTAHRGAILSHAAFSTAWAALYARHKRSSTSFLLKCCIIFAPPGSISFITNSR